MKKLMVIFGGMTFLMSSVQGLSMMPMPTMARTASPIGGKPPISSNSNTSSAAAVYQSRNRSSERLLEHHYAAAALGPGTTTTRKLQRQTFMSHNRTSKLSMKKIPFGPPLLLSAAAASALMFLALVIALVEQGSSSSSISIASAAANPSVVEAEVLTDLAHVTLDVASMLGLPSSRLGVRLSSIIGRVLVIAADYVPDHSIFAEELVFQSIMLALAAIGLCRSALPLLLAAGSSGGSRHDTDGGASIIKRGKAYLNLLQPTGMSWQQFKAMDVLCMDWMALEAGHVLVVNDDEDDENGKYVYWLYSGNLCVAEQDRPLYNMTATSGRAAAQALVGEAQLMLKHNNKQKSVLAASDSVTASTTTPTTMQAGLNGATLLRIHVPKLRVLYKADKELEDCMRTLAFQSLQGKLQAAQSIESTTKTTTTLA